MATLQRSTTEIVDKLSRLHSHFDALSQRFDAIDSERQGWVVESHFNNALRELGALIAAAMASGCLPELEPIRAHWLTDDSGALALVDPSVVGGLHEEFARDVWDYLSLKH